MISEPLPLSLAMLLILLAARMLGEIFERMKQPAMIGEILAGVILGPSLLNVVQITPEIKIIADLGVFLLVIIAGMEIDLNQIIKSIRGRSAWIAILGFVIPMMSGLIIGYVFALNFTLTVFIALCISITALPVSVRILMDLGKLQSDIGQKIISAAIFNDVVSLLVLGVILDINSNDQKASELFVSIGITILKVIGFMILVVLSNRLIRKTTERMSKFKIKVDFIIDFLKGKESLFAVVITFGLLFASISEVVGLHFIVGAFFGAMLLSHELFSKERFEEIHKSTSGITMGFLAPIFFASMGLEFNFLSLTNIALLIVIIIASFASKIIAGYLGGRIAGMNNLESFTLGMGLNSRGIIELVIANIALKNGFIDVSVFSILVLMGIVTTVISPIVLKHSFAALDRRKVR